MGLGVSQGICTFRVWGSDIFGFRSLGFRQFVGGFGGLQSSFGRTKQSLLQAGSIAVEPLIPASDLFAGLV